MSMPPYVRGLVDIFSSGKRTAAFLALIGVPITLISLATSNAFSEYLYNQYYGGPIATASTWTYIGIFLLLLAVLVFLGDARYSSIRQEIEGGKRLRSAEERLENSVKGGSPLVATNVDYQGPDAPDDTLALSVLWEVTNARLSQYHRIATGQARRSFTTAQVAIGIGFMLLFGFAWLSFRTHSTAASITIAALGGAAAGLAGYIGRTFIRSQETAARYLRAYFDQPLAFSRYLAAERLLSSQSELKPEERDAMLRIIIAAMVGSDFNGDPESSNEGDALQFVRNLLKIPGVSSAQPDIPR